MRGKTRFDSREYIYVCSVTELTIVTFIFISIIKKCAELLRIYVTNC